MITFKLCKKIISQQILAQEQSGISITKKHFKFLLKATVKREIITESNFHGQKGLLFSQKTTA